MLAASLTLALQPRAADAFDPGPNPLLMRHPTVSQTAIVFAYDHGVVRPRPRTESM